MVGDARATRVHVGAAELLRRHLLAGRRLHERRAADEDRPGAAHDDRLVRHRRHVGAAGRAGAHHDGDLGDALRGHAGLVVEDPAEVLAVGEDLVLEREEGAARVDEVDAREVVLLRDLLRAEVLLHREREVRAALHRRVVRDDHAGAALDDPDPGDDPRRRRLPRRRRPRRRARSARGRRSRGRRAGRSARARGACRGSDGVRRTPRRRPPRRAPSARGAPPRARSSAPRGARTAASRTRCVVEDGHVVSSVTSTVPVVTCSPAATSIGTHRRVVGGAHDLLHLHRLEHDERLVRLDPCSGEDPHVDHLARHRRRHPAVASPAARRARRGFDLRGRERGCGREVEAPAAVPRPRRCGKRRSRERRESRQEVGRQVGARGRRDARRASGGTAGS